MSKFIVIPNLVKWGFLITSLAFFNIPSASAFTISAINFSGFAEATAGSTTNRGFAFNVVDPNGINITHLSFFDKNGDGLSQPHDVGVWNSGGTLLASASIGVGTTNPVVGSAPTFFRTADIVDVFLPQGNNYVVAAFYALIPSSVPDSERDAIAFNLTALTTPPQISYVQSRFNTLTSGLALPTSTVANTGFIGGSFEFTPVTPIPFEFSPMVGIAGLGVLWGIKKFLKSKKS